MATAAAILPPGALATRRHTVRWIAASCVVLVLAVVAGLTIGPVSLPVRGILAELLDRLPFVDIDSGLTELQKATVWEIRAPRVAVGVMVGAMLSVAGAS